MLEDLQIALRSALRDLGEGLRALLGDAPEQASVVRELLEREAARAPRRSGPVALERRRSEPRPRRPVRRRAGPRRGSASLVLVR